MILPKYIHLGCARCLHISCVARYSTVSQTLKWKLNSNALRGNQNFVRQLSSEDIIQIRKSNFSSVSLPAGCAAMDIESDLDENEQSISHEQHRKRERDKELLGNASPPIKRRARESEAEDCTLELSDHKDVLNDVKEDNSKDEKLQSDHGDGEFAEPLPRPDQVGLLMKAESIDSMGESIQSVEDLSSCEVSLSYNETECESLESSLVGLDNVFEDSSVSILNDEKVKCEQVEGISISGQESKVKKRRKQKQKKSKGDKNEGEGQSGASMNIRPNYFVGVQISNSDIHKSILKVQEELLAYEPLLYRALVDVATTHITLLIARIDDEEALSVACSALDDYGKDIEKEMNDEPIQLTFSGVDHFSNNVLYAYVVEDEHHQRLLDFADRLRQAFTEKGVCMPNMKPLNPHLTIAKMSKVPRGKGKPGPRKIDPESYAKYKDLHFGCQHVKSLQLLAMNRPKDENRYYYCCKEVRFGEETGEKGDHTLCCIPRRPFMSSLRRQSFSTKASEDPSIFASSVGYVTALAASIMILYVVGKVSGRL